MYVCMYGMYVCMYKAQCLVFSVHVVALDERLQQLSSRTTVATPSNRHHLDELTAQQEKNQLALMQLQQQMHALNQPRCVSVVTGEMLWE